MAYQIAAILMTLSDLQAHSPNNASGSAALPLRHKADTVLLINP